MRYLRPFNESKSVEDYISLWTKSWDDYTINPDGTVDVVGDVSTYHHPDDSLTELPIQFGTVTGNFDIGSLENLTTLKGCPHTVGFFGCNGLKKITSLEGGPNIVFGDFDAGSTGIVSLIGGPSRVNGRYYVANCPLTSLEGAPKICDEFIVRKESGSGGNVWDPRPLKGCDIKYIFALGHPFNELMQLFKWKEFRANIPLDGELHTKRFLESLDYNYLKGESWSAKIDLFRLKEALAEFEIEEPYPISLRKEIYGKKKLHHYIFVDENGDYVDFDGNPI